MIAFLGGGLPPDARASVEQHIDTCSACAELLTWAASDQASAASRRPGLEGRPFVGDLHPGARVDRYQILGAVGRGGMGEVYAAYHPDLDRRIALKVVRRLDGGTAEQRARLLREARAIARLSHPNVVTVHDAGTFDDRVFIAMELIDGQTIDEWLAAAPRTWLQILDVFIAAGRGLVAAHAAGVVHRDFKPQNVMIAKDGAVRVMDFGLARLAGDDAGDRSDPGADSPPIHVTSVTKTGAIVGTPAYMSPEQFRREGVDARSDQFSFCVALHEALYGARPAAALAGMADLVPEPSKPVPRAGVPIWLRGVVRRGASLDREARYRSMEELLAALERGRTRLRRRLTVAAIVVATLVLSAGAWRLGHANRVVCAIPADRVAAAWSTDAANPRRLAIHSAFATSGRATAESSWGRVAAVLDDYARAWGAMYVQTCEATHVRGEQSAAVLDLRMSCLNDNLDQVRALTDALSTADKDVVSHAVTAAQNLTPVSRCADVALLKSAVPLPKDERTLREVQRLRRSLVGIRAVYEVGRPAQALAQAAALRAQVEATAYAPLLAELLTRIGIIETSIDEDPSRAESTLRKGIALAIASHDDVTAAEGMSTLVYLVGFRLGRPKEAEAWAELDHAILDRIGGGQERVRFWLLSNQAAVKLRVGDYEAARALQQKSVELTEKTLGATHPDLGQNLSNLSYVLTVGGHPTEGLAAARRSIDVLLATDDSEAFGLAFAYCNMGDALNALGKYTEAEAAYNNSIRLFEKEVGAMHPELAFALHGLGTTKLAQGQPAIAVSLLDRALRSRTQPGGDPVLAAETQFALARALWDHARDRHRALSLASTAQKTFATQSRPAREQAVAHWLETRPKR